MENIKIARKKKQKISKFARTGASMTKRLLTLSEMKGRGYPHDYNN